MADSISIKDFSPEELKQLSPEELNFLNEQEKISNTPSPGVLEGTARAVSQGAVGYPQGQPKDTAFGNQHPVASGGGGMLGRMADYILPILGGRYAMGKASNFVKPRVDPFQARIDAVNKHGIVNRNGSITLDALGKPMVERDVARAVTADKSAERWERRAKLAGGLAGGIGGGVGSAYLHGEDPQSGALIGGAIGGAPLVGAGIRAAVPGGVGNFIGGLGTGAAATAAAAAGAPSYVVQGLKDFSLGKWLKAAEGDKKK